MMLIIYMKKEKIIKLRDNKDKTAKNFIQPCS